MKEVSNHIKDESLYLAAVHKQPIARTPVWIMRQAGRYLPEYREIRSKVRDFMELCKDPALASTVTLQPISRFNLDAAIIFSDILTVVDAMDLGLKFEESIGPTVKKTIRTENDLKLLQEVDPSIHLDYVQDAIKYVKSDLPNSKSLIGFVGSPFTVATYMVEGKSSKTFNEIKKLVYGLPEVAHVLLEHLARQLSKALSSQIVAGVDAVMIFDTWGGILTDDLYKEFSLKYMQQIVNSIKDKHPSIPITLFTKNSGRSIIDIANTGTDVIGLDWSADIKQARAQVGSKVALQGNLDPATLYAPVEIIKSEIDKILAGFGHGSGHIFNLGHGIFPDTDPEKLKYLIDYVAEASVKYHAI